MKIIDNYNLISHNTFGIKAFCNQFIELFSVEEVKQIASEICFPEVNRFIIGSGSNLLFTKDFQGIILHSKIMGLSKTESNGSVLLRVGSGVNWDDFVNYCVDNDLSGLENLSGVPGEVGAAAVQNIGAYGIEVKDFIHTIEAVDLYTGEVKSFMNKDCKYGYRKSVFKQELAQRYFITYVTFLLPENSQLNLGYGDLKKELESKGFRQPTCRDVRDVVMDIRNRKLPDPKVLGNAGSFFINPIVPHSKYMELLSVYPDIPSYNVGNSDIKIPAGWLIEKCGWKGRTLGNAGVYDKQALVLVNKGNATGKDIENVCNRIVEDVYDRFGIKLTPEVNIL